MKENNDTKISFIIPVYNTDLKLLERCLHSIVSRVEVNYETILIDDGSDVIKREENKRIANRYNCRYYFQENKGVSAARNLGITKANGLYICFVDSDDEVDPSVIKKKDLNAEKQLILYDVLEKVNKEKSICKLNIKENPSIKEVEEYFLQNSLMNWAFGKLFLKKFLLLNQLYFNEKKINAEDLDFVFRCIQRNPAISYYSKILYIYDKRDDTAKQRIINYPVKYLNSIVEVYLWRKDFLKGNKNNGEIIRNLNQDLASQLFYIFEILVVCKSSKKTEMRRTIIDYLRKINFKHNLNVREKIKLNWIFTNNILAIHSYYYLAQLKKYIKLMKKVFK